MRKILMVTAVVLPLQGCFFVAVVPGSVQDGIHDMATGEQGNRCVSEAVKVGDPVKMPDGKIGKVTAIDGKSSRCTDTDKPIRATVTV